MLGVGQILGGCLQLEHASEKGANKEGLAREISIDELKERNGIQYLEEWGEAKPFTGTAIDYLKYESQLEIPYVRGKKHGMEIHYRKDGTKLSEEVYKNGKYISFKKF